MVLEVGAGEEGVQGVAKLMEQRVRLVGAEQAARRLREAAHHCHNRFLVAAVCQPPPAAQSEVRRPWHLPPPDPATPHNHSISRKLLMMDIPFRRGNVRLQKGCHRFSSCKNLPVQATPRHIGITGT